jgi:hypothetical protein
VISNLDILRRANVSCAAFKGRPNIYITKADQLLGAHNALTTFRSTYRDDEDRLPYTTWEAHHIVEYQDLGRLGISSQFPERKDQLCVLLPYAAHRKRIKILQSRNPSSYSVTAPELMSAYREAYDLVGDYTGGGKRAIKDELLAIVDAVFRLASLTI